MCLRTEKFAGRGRRSAGVAIVVVMLMLLIVISFTAAAGVVSRQNYTNATHKERMLEAEYAFKAGLATAMERLAEQPAWNPSAATPTTETISDDGRVGFKLWLDGINRNSATPIMSASGLSLQRGQAAVRVIPIIDGQEILGGFGGIEATSFLVLPSVEFPHNILSPHPTEPLTFFWGNSALLSYDSNTPGGIPVFTGSPASPPSPNRSASVRALSDIVLGPTQVFGEVILPTSASLTVGGGSYLAEQRLDSTVYNPHFAQPDPSIALTPTGVGNQSFTPGHYGVIFPGDNATIELQRGGTYFFQEMYLGAANKIELTGPASAGPCVIYTHTFWTGNNSEINMPAPGSPPVPSDLQLYMTPEFGCEVLHLKLGDNSSAAMVAAGHSMRVTLYENAQLYGAVIAKYVELSDGAAIHYDQALLGIPMAGQPQWALVSQGR